MTRVEYLAIFPRTDSFCDTPEAFIRLLQVDSAIVVQGGEIRHNGAPAYEMRISTGEVKGREQRYFHLFFEWAKSVQGASKDETERFLRLLKAVRSAVAQAGGDTETLRDDVSTHYACAAYPLVHEIENLMRRLIANFMLVTIGRDWVDEALPDPVLEAVRNQKRRNGRRDYLNILYAVDFIHLGEFLFTPYSKKSAQELYARLTAMTEADDLAQLKEYVPRSNWARYFGAVVKCQDTYLKSRWARLYELRCQVAHNGMMTAKDLSEIEELIADVKPKLQEAIKALSKVVVPRDEIELVAERAASNINSAVGEFISCWQQLEVAICEALTGNAAALDRPVSSEELLRRGLLVADKARSYEEIRRFRNAIVHGAQAAAPVDVIQNKTAELRTITNQIEEASAFAYLKSLSLDELEEKLQERIEAVQDDILESEAFASAMAETNASEFSVDEVSIDNVEVREDEIAVRIGYAASGVQNDEQVYCGDRISGQALATIDRLGSVSLDEVTAGVDHDEPEDEEGP